MTLWPRSLFGRLTLLLITAVAIVTVATTLFFRYERSLLLEQHFGDTKLVQLQALQSALAASDSRERRETLRALGERYGAQILPQSEHPMAGGGPPLGPRMVEFQDRLRESLGPDTQLRVVPHRQMFFVRVVAGGDGYWVGFPMPPRQPPTEPFSRALIWSLVLAVALIVTAFLFTRYLGRPLRELNAAVLRVGRGESPPALPESGPSEIAELNRGFNRMIAELGQLEQDRALLLAGVSHDLRTPLARLRLGLELDAQDPQTRQGMIDDIEEMDRVIGQFLDFARGEDAVAVELADANAIVAACVERYARAGKDVRFTSGDLPPIPLRNTALSRLVNNLIDNALAYGGAPVDVSTMQEGQAVRLDVADRGPGIPPAEVARLKLPFTRASAARTSESGVAGAGLGLAIVDRIARLHGGAFDLLPREGGGTIARVTLPIPGTNAGEAWPSA